MYSRSPAERRRLGFAKNADESAIAAGTVIHLTLPVIRPTAPKKPISNTASAFMTRI